MITGKVSLGPKSIYLSELGRDFNSSLGGDTTEGGIKELAKGRRGS